MFEYTRTEKVLLAIKGVSLTLGGKLILRDVNATVTDLERPDQCQGQVICFLGPSGVGKTQLARIIAGLQRPSAGSVTLMDGPTERGKVGVVPQTYPLFEYATVATNLLIAGKQAGLTKGEINEKATTFIEAFDLLDHLDKFPRALSGGTKQRVAIARQLMCASNYMVMDEPFSGLDPIMKKRATNAIIKLSQLDTNNTIIVVTHDITEGLSVADTVWLMGYERDAALSIIPGARLVEQHDLASLGFTWRPDISRDPDFLAFVSVIKDRFQTLR